MKKKLQVFVSSTFLDLKDERQKAVEGILRAGHIPAGMERFTAASKSQWKVIEGWIKESDILMLILGGKYGTVEPDSGKSYTQLEYEFALENNIPVFALVLNQQFLVNKKSADINLKVFEHEVDKPANDKYIQFKTLVESNLVKFIGNINEISTEVVLSIHEFMSKDSKEYSFKGWLRGTDLDQEGLHQASITPDFQKEIENSNRITEAKRFFKDIINFFNFTQDNVKVLVDTLLKNIIITPSLWYDFLDLFHLFDLTNDVWNGKGSGVRGKIELSLTSTVSNKLIVIKNKIITDSEQSVLDELSRLYECYRNLSRDDKENVLRSYI